MKKISILTSFVLFATLVFAQQSMTIQELKAKYGTIILAVKKAGFDEESIYLDKKINPNIEEPALAAFAEQYQGYIELMMKEYITVNSDEFKFVKDSTKLQRKFGEKLQEDPLFNQYFLPLLATYYQSKGYTITGFDYKKPSYSFATMVDVTVKYYEVQSIDSRGNFQTRLGIGDNGLVKTRTERLPLLESYCLYIIRQNQYKAYKALEDAKKVVAQLQMGLSEGDQIKRAEGAIYALVSQDERLRDLLRADYERNAEGLPFVITFE